MEKWSETLVGDQSLKGWIQKGKYVPPLKAPEVPA